MRLTSLALLILAYLFPMQAQSQAVRFSALDVRSDLAFMYESMQQTHFNLYAYTSKREYDKAYKAILRAVGKDSLGLLEATRHFQKLAAVSNTGHCEVDFAAQAYIEYAMQGGKLFPLELAFEDGAALVRKNFSANTQVKPGDQVVTIDKKPIEKWQEKIHPYLSAERAYFKKAKLEFWSFPRMLWSVQGERASYTLQLKSADGKVSTHTLEAIPVMDYEAARNGELLKADRFMTYYGETAYLHPGTFSSAEPDGEAHFKAFIDSAFTDMQLSGSTHLIVDLRNNAGGHNAYSDYLIAYFADKPFRWYSSFRIKTSDLLKKHTSEGKDPEEFDDYARQIMQHTSGESFAYELPAQQPMPEAKRFKGKVYVLINRQTYSMAAVSAALIQDYKFGQIIGEETGDVPTLYASQFSFTLPRTGVTVKVPKGYMVRPSGDETLAGVLPDDTVRDHLLDEKDEILTHTLKKIAADGQNK